MNEIKYMGKQMTKAKEDVNKLLYWVNFIVFMAVCLGFGVALVSL
jgi:hypothetical protein